MQAVGIYDTLTFKPNKSGEIKLKCRWGVRGIPEPRQNLAYRAGILLKSCLNEKRGAEIILDKRIPAGAGLGGGSSDAAAVLKGLCKLWKKRVPVNVLNKLAEKLGADVAFFLTGGCCLAEGIGEKITPLKTAWDNKPLWLVLVKPDFSTSTKEIYCKLDEMRTTADKTARTAAPSFAEWTADYGRVKSGGILRFEDIDFVNDLEPVVIKMRPQIESIKKRLVRHGGLGARAAMMSGSGSSVFGIFPGRDSAERAAAFLKLQLKSSAIFLTTTVK